MHNSKETSIRNKWIFKNTYKTDKWISKNSFIRKTLVIDAFKGSRYEEVINIIVM